jgi:DNA invertase Pin-like site-specific DNA recombinase
VLAADNPHNSLAGTLDPCSPHRVGVVSLTAGVVFAATSNAKEMNMKWWESKTAEPAVPKVRAVAYYRHSAQDRQENSIPIQSEKVRKWADENNVEIIHEFADAGKSGLNAEGRPQFTEMMNTWVKQRHDFQLVLCLDVSRWGRFQDLDLSARYNSECREHGKQVVYTTIGHRDGDRFTPVVLQLERFRAAEYSRELSIKTFDGLMKLARQGYWVGGRPPYGLQRLLLDEQREPVGVLEPGKRKAIHNQRVTLVIDSGIASDTIRRIFDEFTRLGYSEFRIAEGLHADGIPAPGGGRWTGPSVLYRLRNEKYVGTMVYNQTTSKLKTPSRPNPPEEWVRTADAFEGIISLEQFLRAQEILAERRQKYAPERMLGQLDALYRTHGFWHRSLLRLGDDTPSAHTYAAHFGSLDLAFQQLYREQRDRARKLVQDQICQYVPEVLTYSDFLVLDQKLALSIQPAVPMVSGYTAYWPFRPDERHVIDLTLGVLLSDPHEMEIVGYVALPRWLAGEHPLRITSTSTRAELFGQHDLNFLKTLL